MRIFILRWIWGGALLVVVVHKIHQMQIDNIQTIRTPLCINTMPIPLLVSGMPITERHGQLCLAIPANSIYSRTRASERIKKPVSKSFITPLDNTQSCRSRTLCTQEFSQIIYSSSFRWNFSKWDTFIIQKRFYWLVIKCMMSVCE